MLSKLAIVIVVLWALGLISGYTVGGLIHLLLLVALFVLAFRFLWGRRVA